MRPSAAVKIAEHAILELLERGVLEVEIGYRKQELLEALRANVKVHDPAQVFLGIRELANSSAPGQLLVSTSGERRGTRYHFETRSRTAVSRKKTAPALSESNEPTHDVAPCGAIEIIHADNMKVLPKLAAQSYRLIYIDPPFNTGREQARTRIATKRVTSGGDRTGFQGARFETTVLGRKSFADSFDDYIAFLEPRLREAHRLLAPDGSLFLHLDYREVHYAKVLLDHIFGRESFINEIIWAYDYGARSKKKWSAKHDNILWYAKDPSNYVFDYDAMDRIPYMAPGLVGPEKAARGKTPTDVWWHTIVSPNGKEKTGYPTQKPLGVLRRIVSVHSEPGDHLLDFFAGSGSFGEAGASLGRSVTLIDSSPDAIEVMQTRLAAFRRVDSKHEPTSPSNSAPPRLREKAQIPMF